MLIGELADTVDLPSQTIRFYERRGRLPEPRREANGYRAYGSFETIAASLHARGHPAAQQARVR